MNTELYYTQSGEGRVLVLLHGNGEDSSFFKAQIEYFGHFFKVLSVDTRGHGKSPRGNSPFTLSVFADDLCSLLDDLSIEKVNILGFSDGANIAMLFAVKYPHRVDRLVINGGNMRPCGMKFTVWFDVMTQYAFTCAASIFVESYHVRRDILHLMACEPHLKPVDLGKITASVLVIVGNRDMIRERHTRLLARSISHSKMVVVDGNHFVVYNKPYEFNMLVGAFLGCE